MADIGPAFTDGLEGLAKGTDISLCGTLTGIQRKRNKEGKLWAAMTLEDLKGTIELMAFSTVYDAVLPGLVEDRPVLVRGLVLPEENAPPKISAQSITPLDNVAIRYPALISLRVVLGGKIDRAAALTELFEKKPGVTSVRLRLEKRGDFSLILDTSAKVKPDKEFKKEIERICGPEAFEVLAS